jgi:hypothetical protein
MVTLLKTFAPSSSDSTTTALTKPPSKADMDLFDASSQELEWDASAASQHS